MYLYKIYVSILFENKNPLNVGLIHILCVFMSYNKFFISHIASIKKTDQLLKIIMI